MWSKECHFKAHSSHYHHTTHGTPKPRLNMFSLLNSSISLVLKFSSAEKVELKKKNSSIRLCFCNPDISFTLQRRVMVWRKAVMEIMTVLLMRPVKLPLQILKNVWMPECRETTWFWKGGCITCTILSTYLFITYSLMFMCSLGSVYLQKCWKNPKCLSIKSLY